MQGSMDANATRLQISELAAKDPAAAQVLDAGIVGNRHQEVEISSEAQKKFVQLKFHTRWRFLLNTNGHVVGAKCVDRCARNLVRDVAYLVRS